MSKKYFIIESVKLASTLDNAIMLAKVVKESEIREEYNYEELDSKAKDKARLIYFDINTDHEWWKDFCSGMQKLGINITEFDLERKTIKGNLCMDMDTSAQKIMDAYDEHEIVQTAENFLKLSNDLDAFDEDYDPKYNDLERNYLSECLQDCLKMLNNEYEWLISDDSVEKTIIANEYTFTKTGERFKL